MISSVSNSNKFDVIVLRNVAFLSTKSHVNFVHGLIADIPSVISFSRDFCPIFVTFDG